MGILRKYLWLVVPIVFFANYASADTCENDPYTCTPTELCSKTTEKIDNVLYWISSEEDKHLKVARKIKLNCGAKDAMSSCQSKAEKCGVLELCKIATIVTGSETSWNQDRKIHVKVAKSFGLNCGVSNDSIAEIDSKPKILTLCDKKPAACISQTLCEKAADTSSGQVEWRIKTAPEHVKEAKKRKLDCIVKLTAPADLEIKKPKVYLKSLKTSELTPCDKKPAACISQTLCEKAADTSSGQVEWRIKTAPEHVKEAKKRKLDCRIKAVNKVENKVVSEVAGKEVSVETSTLTEQTQNLFNKADFKKLRLAERKQLQFGLKRLGYYNGTIDGLYGPMSQNAVRNYARDKKLVDGYPNSLLTALITEPGIGKFENVKLRLLPTSTDLRYAMVCEGIDTGKTDKMFSVIRNLKQPGKHYSYENIGISIIADLYSDGILNGVTRFHSYKTPRPLRKNIQFFSPIKKQMLSRSEGMLFANEQPATKEIRKLSQGDLNADGVVDLVFFDYGEHDGDLHDGQIIVLMSVEGNYAWQVLDIPSDLRIHTGVLIDVDGDRDLDIVYGASSRNGKYKNTIFGLKNDGLGAFKKFNTPKADSRNGWSWVSFNASDIDNDGHHDLIMEFRKWKSRDHGTRILWGSDAGVFSRIDRTDIKSRIVKPRDILMDSIVVRDGASTHIYATYVANNYQAGTKFMKYSFKERNFVSEKLIVEPSEFRTQEWLNTIYPCVTGHKVFTFSKSDYDLSSRF